MRRSFQSTLPRRERPRSQHKDAAYRNFNPRSREGSDGLVKCGFISINISIHAPAKGATIRLCNENDIKPISIHAPAKGATLFACILYLKDFISIHAPAKGATKHIVALGALLRFQSTLPRRERLFVVPLLSPVLYYFNPRSREGSDAEQNQQAVRIAEFQSTLPRRERRGFERLSDHVLSISIHAPAKGATAELLDMAAKRRAFQSTLPRRERRTARSRRPRSSYFNPRSREGSDPRVLRTRRHRPAISIHAPAKGATSSAGTDNEAQGISIHAPAKGATHSSANFSHITMYFNPRSREGSDRCPSLVSVVY